VYIPITKNFTIKVCRRKKSPLLLYFTISLSFSLSLSHYPSLFLTLSLSCLPYNSIKLDFSATFGCLKISSEVETKKKLMERL
jgi:hypothetical protein